LFVRPDYHCSFFLRDQFRRLGWKADIFVNPDYPDALLYSGDDVLHAPQLAGRGPAPVRYLNRALLFLWYLAHFWRYEYHLYYGRPPVFSVLQQRLGLWRRFCGGALLELWLAKLFRVRLIFFPTGCLDAESKLVFGTLDAGKVCGNCGMWDRCDDRVNNIHYARIRKYFDIRIGTGELDSSQFLMSHIKYKSIDLTLWSPGIDIPPEHELPETGNVRILHSSYVKRSGRDWGGRNIKGSPYILAAIDRLQREGYPVEYMSIENKPSNQMRYYQAQADIVVEQLIYGWWGSTGVETMALGKPVVCYLRPAWKEFFLKAFPEYAGLPIVEADTETIYDVLKELVVDEGLRRRKGKESRTFAEAHFDPERNTRALADLLTSLHPEAEFRSGRVALIEQRKTS
jgi:hypothetical protein